MLLRFFAAVVVTLWFAGPVHAQTLRLAFNDGKVSLSAQSVPLRAILTEWSRLGGTRIVNLEGVAGPPVTLEITDQPERQVIDILLRSVSGYMLASRPPGAPGNAVYDRIMILPTSTPPRNPPPAPGSQNARPAFPPRPPAPVDADPNPGEDPPDPNDDPNRPPPREMPVVPRPSDGVPQGDAPLPTPVQPGTGPTQSNPFGVPFGTSSTPGVVTPAPRVPVNPNVRPDNEP